MNRYPLIFLLKKNIDAAIAAGIGFGLVYIYTSYSGIGVSPDSVAYASVARFLQQGQFLVQLHKMPLVVFPFFYPTFLYCVMGLTGQDVFVTAPVVNALLFALLVYMVGTLLQQFIYKSKWHKWAVLSIVLVSTSLTEIFCMLWSETLFILLSCIFMVALKKYFSHHSCKLLTIAAAIAGFACVTRFAGVVFIAVGGLMLLCDRGLPWKKKWWHLMVFGLVSSFLLIANLVRNYYFEGTLTGDRQQGVTPLKENIQYASNVLWNWFQLPRAGYALAPFIALVIVLFLLFMVWVRWRKMQHFYSYENIAAVFFIVYTSFLVVTATLSRYETINNRLMSPAYIPLLLAVSYWLPLLFNNKSHKNQWAMGLAICFLFCSFQYQQLQHALQWYGEIKNDGIPGYNEMAWKRSPVIYYLHQHKNDFKKGVPIYSNANDAVYFYTGLACETVPETVHYNEVKDYYTISPHYIVWFSNDYDNPDILRLEEQKKYRRLDTLYRFKDGLILWSK